jgi:hypothetical protein
VRKIWVGAAALVAILVGGMLWLLATREPPPLIPLDPDHVAARGDAACLDCHSHDGAAPRSKNHPLGQRCLQCHVRADRSEAR